MSHFFTDPQAVSPALAIACLVAVLGLNFGVVWLVSKLFAGDEGNFVNTLRYFIYQFAAGLLQAAVMWGAISLIPGAEMFFAIVFLIAGLGILFAIPMSVYQIGFLRALGFLVVSWIGGMAASVGIVLAVFLTILPVKFSDLNFSDLKFRPPKSAATKLRIKAPAQPDLVTRVQQTYAALQVERAALNVNDPAAVARFNEHVTAYNTLNADLKKGAEVAVRK